MSFGVRLPSGAAPHCACAFCAAHATHHFCRRVLLEDGVEVALESLREPLEAGAAPGEDDVLQEGLDEVVRLVLARARAGAAHAVAAAAGVGGGGADAR